MSTPERVHVTLDGDRTYDVELREEAGRLVATIGGRDHIIDVRGMVGPETVLGVVDGRPHQLRLQERGGSTLCSFAGRTYRVDIDDPRSLELRRRAAPARVRAHGHAEVRSPIAGVVTRLLVGEGACVTKGQPVALIEAMKMENRMPAARAGRVEAVAVREGERVRAGQLLLVIGD